MRPFTPKALSDQQLIAGIRAGGKREYRCLNYIYQRNSESVIRFVLKSQGTREEGIEIFQEAVIVLYEKIKKQDFQLQSNTKLSTFLFAIAKNKWFYRKRQKRQSENIPDQDIAIDPWDELLKGEKRQLLGQMMDQLGEDCKKILTLSIYEQINMAEISQLMGLKNQQVARNKKYKCLQYLKQIVLRSGIRSRLMEKD